MVRHDGDDTYLVVAADKGTATFSDIANEVAVDYGFWLGDAFASGGSVGYDHKAMGITARGAWESVKRHFRELGLDTQTEDFTVVGVGDMSGDVFGNGMLLSEHIRLVAAFDHRHIFLDPTPDPADLLRRAPAAVRPAALARWADYDTHADLGRRRRLPAHRQVDPGQRRRCARRSASRTGVAKLTPAELMQAILLAPVDLLWNGGIGTYVKASTETNADVGDKANDAIRVNGARAAGQGRRRGRQPRAAPSSAGSSSPLGAGGGGDQHRRHRQLGRRGHLRPRGEHQDPARPAWSRAGDLTVKQRNALLAAMTDEVGDLVLRDNYAQNVALGQRAWRRRPPCSTCTSGCIRRLVARRATSTGRWSSCPTDRQIRERLSAGPGPDPAGARGAARLHQDHRWPTSCSRTGAARRPVPARAAARATSPRRCGERFARRRSTRTRCAARSSPPSLVNDMVNTRRHRPSLLRLREETGATDRGDRPRAHRGPRDLRPRARSGTRSRRWTTRSPADVQTRMRLHSRRLVERATRWLLNNRPQPLDIAETIEFFRERCRPGLGAAARSCCAARTWSGSTALHEELTEAGVPEELAARVAGFSSAFPTLDIVEVADRSGKDAARRSPRSTTTSPTGCRSPSCWTGSSSCRAPTAGSRWPGPRSARTCTRRTRRSPPTCWRPATAGRRPEQRFKAWEEKNATLVDRARTTLDEIQGCGDVRPGEPVGRDADDPDAAAYAPLSRS